MGGKRGKGEGRRSTQFPFRPPSSTESSEASGEASRSRAGRTRKEKRSLFSRLQVERQRDRKKFRIFRCEGVLDRYNNKDEERAMAERTELKE